MKSIITVIVFFFSCLSFSAIGHSATGLICADVAIDEAAAGRVLNELIHNPPVYIQGTEMRPIKIVVEKMSAPVFVKGKIGGFKACATVSGEVLN